MVCLPFSDAELYELWQPFQNEPDGGLEALCGFMGLGEHQDPSVAAAKLMAFQERAELRKIGLYRSPRQIG